MSKITRRSFLKRGSLAVTTLGGLKLGLMPRMARADWIPNNFVLSVFLRGGMDGLNTVVPISGNDRSEYEIKRPFLKLPATGQFAALPLGTSPFGLHWAASGLHELYGEGRLAIVHATGMPTGFNTRSHFDAQDYMDHGTPGRDLDRYRLAGTPPQHRCAGSGLVHHAGVQHRIEHTDQSGRSPGRDDAG
jgi:uncharacterized protein (DUF1501 family)